LDDKCNRLEVNQLREKVDAQNLETILERVKGEAVSSEGWKTLEIQREIPSLPKRRVIRDHPSN